MPNLGTAVHRLGIAMADDYYANAFLGEIGRCFRFVHVSHKEGQPDHCSKPATWIGAFRAKGGRLYKVTSCDGHKGALEHPQPYLSPN
jgi:hypothetical protein